MGSGRPSTSRTPSLPCRTVVLWSVPGTALVSQLGKGQPGNMPWALEH